jgi:uncharacterized protein (UPF0332 family)
MSEFEKCISKNMLVKIDYAEVLIEKEMNEAHEDLEDARSGLERGRHKWSIVQSYYAMFHAGRALLLSRGYREKSHYCLCVGLRHLFVEQDILAVTYVENLSTAKDLREAADYEGRYGAEAAKIAFDFAEGFLKKADELLIIYLRSKSSSSNGVKKARTKRMTNSSKHPRNDDR